MTVQDVQTIPVIPSPPLSSPADAGEDEGEVEPFGCAQDRLREAIERLERLEL